LPDAARQSRAALVGFALGVAAVAYIQSDLLADLVQIFPEFASWWEEECEAEEVFHSCSLHSVYMSLLPFLGHAKPTQQQWKLLAAHLSKEVVAGGDRENAVATCVLEHLHQVKLDKILFPLLGKL
jgi:hypothetical protein